MPDLLKMTVKTTKGVITRKRANIDDLFISQDNEVFRENHPHKN